MEVMGRDPLVTELLPAELGSGTAFDRLVAATCARRWLPTDLLVVSLPATYKPRLFCARQWATKHVR